MKIWNITEGPFHVDDMPYDPDVPDGMEVMMVCLAELDDGKMAELEIWFESFDECYEIVKHFQSKIEPIVLSEG